MMQPFHYYPENYEEKVGFDKLRELLRQGAESPMGREKIDQLKPTNRYDQIERRLAATGEMMRLYAEGHTFPSFKLQDLRSSLRALKVEGTYLSERELPALRNFFATIKAIITFFDKQEDAKSFPVLRSLLRPDITRVPGFYTAVDQLLDRFGDIKDMASSELLRIRKEILSVERTLSKIVRQVLARSIEAGWCEADAQPTLRDGHFVLPVLAFHKRSIKGVILDESATGKTFFVEPIEVIEVNNRVRELRAEEKKEIIRILIQFSSSLRPHLDMLLSLYKMAGIFDAICAMARFSMEEEASIPKLIKKPHLRWKNARHPILRRNLLAQGRTIVPLDISLDSQKGRILVISGPNAGGKSVCLKTCGLLQLMLQMGLPIPVDADSEAGIFADLAINIGDDQSIENDLSTYSSHLRAMSAFCKVASPRSLLLIDEFGAGTEPELGGALAESLLAYFNQAASFAVITTHYRNLKEYASQTDGIVNGAMLYDRSQMRPLFTLSIGQPGSSFAMEIARRAGLPQRVLERTREKVGSVAIESDHYVQDIARDKRYWEKKREEIRKKNISIEELSKRYKEHLEKISEERRRILEEARQEAKEIVRRSNAVVEQAVKEIREQQADKQKTIAIRQQLQAYGKEVEECHFAEDASLLQHLNKERNKETKKSKQKKKGAHSRGETSHAEDEKNSYAPTVGDSVTIKSSGLIGTILEINGNDVLLALGNALKIKTAIEDISLSTGSKSLSKNRLYSSQKQTSNIADHLHAKMQHFKTELDVRGMRLVDALHAVESFVDEALQLGFSKVRVLHGTGMGALREGIRQYLRSTSWIKDFYDEDVRFGGAGITIIEL